MKLLHTADWHVGKSVRGQSRAAEHEAVLAEIAGVAETEAVDLVVVAGDLFDSTAPTAESERIVYRALLDLARDDRVVVVVAGNHDHPRRLAAVAPVFESGRVHVQTRFARADEGGVLTLTLDGTPVNLVLLPFLSKRHVIGADLLMSGEAAEHTQHYADRYRRLVGALTAELPGDAVNIVVAHAMVAGATLGGGERSAHTIFEYAVSPVVFPASLHYVALGHLHRTQQIAGPAPTWYPGSPLQLDFGEVNDTKNVLVVEAEPSTPAHVTQVPLESGRRFRTVSGTIAELTEHAELEGDDYLRVIVRESLRVGLADEVRELFPGVVEIRIDGQFGDTTPSEQFDPADRPSPHDLFVGYLGAQNIDDSDLVALFDELLEHVLDEAVAEDAS